MSKYYSQITNQPTILRHNLFDKHEEFLTREVIAMSAISGLVSSKA